MASPGASVAGVTGVHSSAGRWGSLTVTPVRLVLPVLVTRTVYVIAWPSVSYVVALGVLVTLRAAAWLAVTVALAGGARTPPPAAAAVLVTLPASRSAWLTR